MDVSEQFQISIEIGGTAEKLQVERIVDNSVTGAVYAISLSGNLLAKVWTEFSDEGLHCVSTDLIGSETLQKIGRAIENHYA